MRLSYVAATAAALVGSALASAQDPATKPAAIAPAPAPAELKDLKSKVSYGFGLGVAKNLKAQGAELDPDLIAKGLRDGLGGGKALLTDAEIQQAIAEFQQLLVAKQGQKQREMMAGAAKQGDANKKDGAEFLAANKAKPGVVSLPSGIQYKILREGDGPKPKATDTVRVNYEGRLISGDVFDASALHGGPSTFPLNRVIKGWTEGVQQMKVGSKYQFFIPSELAYAERGSGEKIGPNATLIFDIELLGIGGR